jgi:LacI family transcriptional regulator
MTHSDQPKYLLIAQELEKQIASGLWTGKRVPSVRALAEEHHVSIVTASRALQLLSDRGLVDTVARSGCYVRTPQTRSAERWGLCLHVTPGPWQMATASITAQGFESAARAEGVELFPDLFQLPDELSAAGIQRQVQEAVAQGLTGVFLLPSRISEVGARQDELLVQTCRQANLAVVLVERNLRGLKRALELDLVCSDDLEGGRLLTQHLLECGCQRIAFVIGSPTSSHSSRLAGYLLALAQAERGKSPAPLILEQSADRPSRDAFVELVDQLLAARADGVICYQDYTAIGLIVELLMRGVRVPRDLAVCGFDDLPIGSSFAVGVTTYAFPSEEVARRAFGLMRHRLQHPAQQVVKIVVAGQLLVRESSGGACL